MHHDKYFINKYLYLFIISLSHQNLMQAPQSPVDIKVTLGNPTGCHNLLNIDIDFSDDKQ